MIWLLVPVIVVLFNTGCSVNDRRMEEWAQTRQIEKLQRVALSSDQKTKIRAIDLLGQSAHSDAAAFLLKCLAAKDLEVRVHAAIAIGRLGTDVGLPDADVHSLVNYLNWLCS